MSVLITTSNPLSDPLPPGPWGPFGSNPPRVILPGTFEATGEIEDSGAIHNLRLRFGPVGAPLFGLTHATLLFIGTAGTFILEVKIRERGGWLFTAMEVGTWHVIGGTRAYAYMYGDGAIIGTNDDPDLINRSYSGDVVFEGRDPD